MVCAVLTMQALCQEVHGLALPRCLEKSREHFVAGMDDQLEGIVAFIRADMDREALRAYTTAKARLMKENFVKFGNKASACTANSWEAGWGGTRCCCRGNMPP